MRDINIQVKENHTVDFENDYAGLNRENLQGNIIFNFDKFISGQARVEIVINNVSGYINLDQVEQTYILPIKSSLLTGNDILMQLVIDEPATYNLTTDTDIDTKKIYYEKVGDNYVQVEHPRKADLGNYYEASIPVWKSETFYLKVGFSINAEETIPEQYPSWIETLNNLINETESAIEQASNVNISATQTQSGATITITNKDGESNSVNITNGADGTDGKDAKINGYNTITIQEGTNIGIEQNGEILTINNTYDDTSIKNDITTLQNTKANKSELSVYSLITETGSKIDLEINSSTYVLVAKLYDKNNNLLSTSTGIDLPLETMVIGATYDSETKEIVLTLKNGQEVRFSVADLVSGLVSETQLQQILLNYYTKSEVDTLLSNKVGFEDYASESKAGILKPNNAVYGTNVSPTTGTLYGATKTYNEYQNTLNGNGFISKGTLENVITGKELTNKTYVDNANEVQDNEISDLKSENDYLNSIINQLPKVSSQGTILTLNNTINGRMNIELGTSELEQETTTGKNLLPLNVLTEQTIDNVKFTPVYENNSLLYIQAKGTASSTVTYRIFGIDTTTVQKVFNSEVKINFGLTGSSSTYGLVVWGLNSGGTDIGTVIYDDTTYASGFQLAGVGLRITSGANVDIKFYPMIRLSTETDTYEPYTGGIPAPNPQFPMPIHTISGNNKVVVCGKNLFDISKQTNENINVTTGEISSNGFWRLSDYIKVEPNTNYMVSMANHTTNNYAIKGVFYDKNKSYISGTYSDLITNNYYGFTTPNNAKYVRFAYLVIIFDIRQDIDNVQFEKGSTATPYTPYVSQEANINLGDIEYCEIGDYKDEFVRDNEGNWGIRKNIGKDKLTSDNVIYHGVDSYRYQYELTPSQNTIKNEAILSNYFYDYGNTNWWTYDGNIIIQNATVIYMTTTKYTSITAFNNFTSANDVYVYYPLATPTYTPITGDLATQLENIYQYLLSYKGTTNISQINNDLPFNISASALLDLNTLVGE